MKTFVLVGLFILLVALWISTALHNQQKVAKDEKTVQAQITAVARPTRTP